MREREQNASNHKNVFDISPFELLEEYIHVQAFLWVDERDL